MASEVRALAQRSADAAKEIKALISTSSAQVASGVSLVGETGKALSRIVSQVAEITAIVGEISASAREQATGLQEVNTAINQMDQMTQQNSAMVDESTAVSENLASEASDLAALIGRFRVGAALKAPSVKTPRPMTLRAGAPKGVSSKTGAPRIAATPRTDARAGGALRLAISRPQTSDDDWEEF